MRWIAVFVLGIGTANAEVYRCEQSGQVIYTDQPCSQSAEPKKLPPLQVVPKNEFEKRQAAEYDQQAKKDKKARDKANQEWVRKHQAKKSDSERIQKAKVQGKVASGMTADQVRNLYGEPDDIRTQERAGVSKEIWTFHLNGGVQTVELTGGKVSKHTDKKSKSKSKSK